MKRNREVGLSRRGFSTGAMAGVFGGFMARASAAVGPSAFISGYGELSPAGNELALPPGFQYSIVSYEGEKMNDGFPVPKAMDGMGTFALPNGNVLLIRNHEDSNAPAQFRPRPANSTSTTAGILNSILETDYGPRSFAYDAFIGGGTTSIEVEPGGQRRRVREHWSLVGTLRNCAGGVTPWGSWLSCEETLEAAAAGGAEKDHGYVFEVPIDTVPGRPAAPIPLKQLGRMSHEAAAVDPDTGIIYETEDQGNVSGFYRFVPARKPAKPGDLASMGGSLEMMAVTPTANYLTSIGQKLGVALPVRWVKIANPDPTPPTVVVDGVTMAGIFKQGLDLGGAIFRRLEGIWYSKGQFYFSSTNGGENGSGQIWLYDPRVETITLVYESPGIHELDFPDNIAVSPRGGIIICEDGAGAQFLRGLTPSGNIFNFARNIHNTLEFAGACFSPDGQTMFVNLYGRGTARTITPLGVTVQHVVGPELHEKAMTLAIWGPWGSGLL